MDAARQQATTQIASHIARNFSAGRAAFAVSGITAAGKSTFAGMLADALRAHGLAVLTASIDDFHHPSARRNASNLSSEQAYYDHAHDLPTLRRRLLGPFTSDVESVQTASLDLQRDVAVTPRPQAVPSSCVLVIDGTFLLKPVLRHYWSGSIWLDTGFEEAAARGAARDSPALGGLATARERYETRYHAACRRYLADHAPRNAATWVVP